MDNQKLTERFWNNVNELKHRKGMTWDSIAQSIGTSANSLATMKNGMKMPSIGYACALADALDVSIDELCGSLRDKDDDKLENGTIQDVLNVICGKLSTNEVLSLALIAEQFRLLDEDRIYAFNNIEPIPPEELKEPEIPYNEVPIGRRSRYFRVRHGNRDRMIADLKQKYLS